MKTWLQLVWFVLSVTGVACAGATTDRWRIETVDLTAHTEFARTLRAVVADSRQKASVALTADVVLTKVRDSYIYGDRLVVYGEAVNVGAVVVFDLLRRREIDWFFCWRSKQVWPGKILSTEWYPAHGFGTTYDDVLLLYDLRKSPLENRPTASPTLRLPLPPESQDSATSDVGIPIYPQTNVEKNSYENANADGVPWHVIQWETLATLSSERLAFIVSEVGKSTSSNWLVIIDLSRGSGSVESKKVDIPKDQLHVDVEWLKDHRRPYNPDLVVVTRIEEVSPTQVRLHVPAGKYGVSSIVVDIPAF